MQRYDEQVTMNRAELRPVRPHVPGAFESAMTSAMSVFLAVLLLWLAGALLSVVAWDTWRIGLAASVVCFAFPFVFLAWGRWRYLLHSLEVDLWRKTGVGVDLDRDNKVGEQEIESPVSYLPAPQEVVRLVRVNEQPARADPILSVGDDIRLPSSKLRELLSRSPIVGLSWPKWNREGWKRDEWEAALAILETHELVKPRVAGRAAELAMSPDEALEALGL